MFALGARRQKSFRASNTRNRLCTSIKYSESEKSKEDFATPARTTHKTSNVFKPPNIIQWTQEDPRQSTRKLLLTVGVTKKTRRRIVEDYRPDTFRNRQDKVSWTLQPAFVFFQKQWCLATQGFFPVLASQEPRFINENNSQVIIHQELVTVNVEEIGIVWDG